ncbi:MogA/MoaB family molybdenum cofactor biosynthesis protein [uncultured Desulfuromonas sp.]|uniref:MogA/MoaB family molybdenum cofactor biosynthesis protein n=1 Tax=uncultured Desulfuromonas sp. TaxID=181013 RepID=UPI002622C003|nr:MogA/MoaB family molybdenum cofactor biosynthesis protein [uncultured Desulfuromonas sp.]
MKGYILTVSDKGSRGERLDASGPALAEWLEERGVRVQKVEVVPDEEERIADRLRVWADTEDAEIILTTGGTGVSPRDVTPEATLQVVERVIPGFGELMRRKSLEKTPMATLSRALAGIRKGSLIINLPGSPGGAVENLEAVWEAVPHAVAKIRGDQSDCVPSRHPTG